MENIIKAINKVMEEVNGVAKNMTVGFWNNSYKWVSDRDVKVTIRESMIKNWLSLIPTWWSPKIQIDRWEEDTTNYWVKQKQSVFTEVETHYLLIHTSWESIQVYGYWHWVDAQDKWAGKATTYALKNTLLNMFLIPTWVDTDDTHSNELDVPKKNNNKPWFNQPEMEKLEKHKTAYTSWDEAIKKISQKYKINNEMRQNILNLYK